MKQDFLTASDEMGMRETGGVNSFLSADNNLLPMIVCLETFKDLQERDAQRKKDGRPTKIIFKRIPTRDGKIIVVPTTTEEKFFHGAFQPGEGGGMSGSGEEGEGEKIGEQDVDDSGAGEGDGSQPGGESGGDHSLTDENFKIGERLVKEFNLPNLKDKGKKFPVDEYTHDLTDRHRGSGQVLDKKETLRSIIKTNLALGRVNKNNPDTTKLIVGPDDKVYRVLSREKVYKSKAIVFFLRDYSGSMGGNPTVAVVNQHALIFSWLLYQYEKMAIPRFILHDTEAKEVSSFEEYFRLSVSGGTKIVSGYRLINEIIEKENLAADYNIYVFQGTDGDDWDSKGEEAIPELKKLLPQVNRMGALVVHNQWSQKKKSDFENYISGADLDKNLFKMTTLKGSQATDEKALINSVRVLVS